MWTNIYILVAGLWLVISAPAVEGAASSAASPDTMAGEKHLAGIYVKDGNVNGQLRFLASGLTSSSSSSSSSSTSSLNSALNQYITNKQDMLEQLRPSTSGTAGSGISSVSGISTSPTTTSNDLVSTSTGGAIYVNLNGGSSSSSSSSSSATNSAINQAIYGASPVADLLPQIVAEGALQRRRPAAAGGINRRRRVQPNRRRRVTNRRGNVNANRRRRGNRNKRGKKKAQVMVVRPNRG